MEKNEQRLIIFKSVLFSVVTVTFLGVVIWLQFGDKLTVAGNDDSSFRQPTAEEMIALESVPDVVESVIPAVVSVVISADVPIIERYYEEFNFPFDFFGGGEGFTVPRQRQIGTEEREIGGGSGFFVSPDGFIVTNRHVVDVDGASYSIVTNDGETYDATVVARDPSLDIAVLKIETTEELPFLTWGDSKDLRLGEPVIAIGNALAEFPNSVSVGVVSGLSRNIVAGGFGFAEQLENVIQTDAAINRGNSGGPLLNARGEVIGVNVAVAGGSENIGFALPSDVVAQVYQSVAEFGEIVRPFLGVRYVQITPEVAKRNNLPVEYGVLVVRGETRADLAVIPGSPADQAGIEENDIILAIEGEALDGTPSLAAALRQYDVGQTIKLMIWRDGEEKEVAVTLTDAANE